MKYLRRLKNLSCCCLVLVLPVGIYQGDPDSLDYQLGFHAGGGRVASVITGCSSPEQAVGNGFIDISGEAYMKVPAQRDLPFVVGLRGGYWRSDVNVITRGYDPELHGDAVGSNQVLYDFGYVNPCVAFETRYFGAGIGYIFGDVPEAFRDGRVDSLTPVTGHVRIGSQRGVNVSYSLQECTPLVSGGGLHALGLSFPLGSRLRSTVGISGRPYYTAGFHNQNRLQLDDRFALDLNWRIGATEGVTEYGVSAGVIYRFGN
jgi:hypothetical protein